MKISALICSTAVVLLFGLGVGSSQAGNCQDALNGNLYHCRSINDDFGPFEACWQFNSTSPFLSDKFDLIINNSVGYGCTCKAKGKVEDPDFNASHEFFCVRPGDDAGALEGKVSQNGKKITDGFFGSPGGSSELIECELDPTCAPPD